MKTLENVTPRVNQVTKILKNSNDDFWDQTRQYQIVRYVIEFNVSVAVMDKISNFPLLHSHATSPLFLRYYMLKKINRRPEGGGHRSMSTPLNTPLTIRDD